MAPGPLAAQVAIYIGYIHYRILGAALVGLTFMLPSFLMVPAPGFAYQHFGGLPWMQALFYGVSGAVIGIITLSSYKLTTKSPGKDSWLWGIFVILTGITFWTKSENIWLILASGALVWGIRRLSVPLQVHTVFIPMLAQIPVLTSESSLFWKIALFFTKAGAFVFGSGLVIIPFLYGVPVKEYNRLNRQQFSDAVTK